MAPEAKARQQIDRRLEQPGWTIQDTSQLNLSEAAAVCENAADIGQIMCFTDNAGAAIPEERACQRVAGAHPCLR